MLRLAQQDPKWGNLNIQDSKYTVGSNGCLITSICMIISKFYPERGFEHFYSPAEAVRDWDFTSVPGDSDPRYLVWNSINESGIKFVWRQYNYQPDRLMFDPVTGEKDLEINILKKYVQSDDYGVVIQVLNSKGGQHWLAAWKWNIFNKPTCFDPWNAKVLWRPFGWLGKYSRMTGWALVRKDQSNA